MLLKHNALLLSNLTHSYHLQLCIQGCHMGRGQVCLCIQGCHMGDATLMSCGLDEASACFGTSAGTGYDLSMVQRHNLLRCQLLSG